MAQPDLIPAPFAENATPGTIEPIPPLTPSVPQQATWSSGFPQVTMQPLAAGGIPPRGQDFNGVLNALSQHIFHMQGGGQYKWDDAHGPYSIGDVLQSDDGLRAYVSIVNNNTDNFNTNPSAIGTSWLPWSGDAKANSNLSIQAGAGLTGGGTLTQNRTLAVQFGTTAGTVAAGNDSRIVNSVQTSGDQTVGGIKTFSSFPVTPSAAPTDNYQVANKKYVDDKTISQPSAAGTITLNGTTDNTVFMTDIVTELGLETGDVIRIDTGTYNKLHTVESITDNSSIIVNYEHAGNRGDGSLRLPDFTGQATVTRIVKWFNAPLGLGQAWVDVIATRAKSTSYVYINRPMLLNINSLSDQTHVLVGGVVCATDNIAPSQYTTVTALVTNSAQYEVTISNATIDGWWELR